MATLPTLYADGVTETQRKKRLWLAALGAGMVFVGGTIALIAIVSLVDAFFGGDSNLFVAGGLFAVVAVAVISFGVWIIRRSGLPISDALNW